MISVVVPTILGREHHLARCLAAYSGCGGNLELLVEHDHPSCGHAWAAGAERATGEYLHFSADDLVPHRGWWQAAVGRLAEGDLPCPRILQPDGQLESCGQWGAEMREGAECNIARIPMLTRAQWNEGNWVLPQHYYTDNWIWHRGQQLGINTVVCRGYLFTHYYAPEGRLDNYDAELVEYQAAGGTF